MHSIFLFLQHIFQQHNRNMDYYKGYVVLAILLHWPVEFTFTHAIYRYSNGNSKTNKNCVNKCNKRTIQSSAEATSSLAAAAGSSGIDYSKVIRLTAMDGEKSTVFVQSSLHQKTHSPSSDASSHCTSSSSGKKLPGKRKRKHSHSSDKVMFLLFILERTKWNETASFVKFLCLPAFLPVWQLPAMHWHLFWLKLSLMNLE